MSYINPAYAAYAPEVLPEVFVTQVSVAGSEIGRYENIGKRLLEIRNLVSTRPAANSIETIVSTDMSNESQKLYSAAQGDVRADDSFATMNKARAKSYVSIRQKSIGGAEANIVTRWHTVVRNYNLLDLYRWGVKNPAVALNMIDSRLQDADRTRILEASNIAERAMVGELPIHPDLLSPSIEEQFEDIKEVPRQIPALAANGGSHILSGSYIRVPPGYVAVILGVSVDAQQVITDLSVGALSPYNACFIYISRDELENYVKLDAAAMPSPLGVAGLPDTEMRMYVPACNKFQVQIVNNHAVNPIVANLRLRVRYGLRKMTDTDHEKWGIPYSTDEEQVAANERMVKYGTRDKIYIGANL